MVKIVNNYNKVAGENLRLARIEAGKSQQDIANLLGITFQQVQKYERGLNRLSAGALKYLGECLGKPIDFFFGTPEKVYTDTVGNCDNRKALNLIRALALIEDESLIKRLESLIFCLAKQEVVAN